MCSRSCDSPLNQNLLHVLPILKSTHFHLKSSHFVLIDTDVIPVGIEYEYYSLFKTFKSPPGYLIPSSAWNLKLRC